jgi:hypothetical protein
MRWYKPLALLSFSSNWCAPFVVVSDVEEAFDVAVEFSGKLEFYLYFNAGDVMVYMVGMEGTSSKHRFFHQRQQLSVHRSTKSNRIRILHGFIHSIVSMKCVVFVFTFAFHSIKASLPVFDATQRWHGAWTRMDNPHNTHTLRHKRHCVSVCDFYRLQFQYFVLVLLLLLLLLLWMLMMVRDRLP